MKSIGPAKLTTLRRRILAALDQQGELDIQEIGYAFSSNPRGMASVFNHPAAATRFGGMLVAPMRAAGWVTNGSEKFGYRYKIKITMDGQRRLRESIDAR